MRSAEHRLNLPRRANASITCVWLVLFVACADPGSPGRQTTDDDQDSAGDTAPETGCYLDYIEVQGEFVPGETVLFRAVGQGEVPDVAWTLTGPEGDLGPMPESGYWPVPTSLAVHQAETIEVRVEGCGEVLTINPVVDWREGDRVVLVYNPAAEGSRSVADAYAGFRGVPETAICGVETTTEATLAGADYPAFVEAVFACVQPWTQYIVPVFGVPYKVSDRVGDLAYGTPATTSLDALLFAGPASADISAVNYNPAYQDGNSASGEYDDYKNLGELRERKDVWIVSRIDGASAVEAIALVDRTREAQAAADAGTLDGIVYVDGNRGDVPPAADTEFGTYEWGEWNMWGTRYVFEAVGLYDVVWDGNSAEFGTDPAPLECPSALYYAGWYSYYNYNDCFDWNVGAIGAHLDSCSACDIRAAGTWSGSALLDGITATFGAVNEPYVAGMPEYDQFYRNLLQGANFGEAAYQSTVLAYWMMVWVGDPLYRPYPFDPAIPRAE